MNLYEIDREILECIDAETGEITDFERLDELNIERDRKIENIALYIKNLNADALKIKAEEQSLTERRKAKETKAARLKEYLSAALNGSKFESAKVCLSFRKSTSVEIEDELNVVEFCEKNGKDDCIKYKMPEIRKSELAKLLKAGEIIPGAVLAEKLNLQMK